MKQTVNRRNFLRSAACAGLAVYLTFGSSACFAEAGEKEKAWEKIPESERAEIMKRWANFKAMPPEAQKKLQAGLSYYKGLNSDQKLLVNRAYDKWKKFTPELKATIKDKFLKWKELTPAEQQEVRAEVRKAMSAK